MKVINTQKNRKLGEKEKTVVIEMIKAMKVSSNEKMVKRLIWIFQNVPIIVIEI